ncbi:hypothetical protein [Pseudobacteriovorax antillogorgiicola]|uniref:Uncharacterized protein n=1 Tax=Pseudobacteriovorax antillogorgiicola TaxID=1513793 RepID=A0A1Y6BRQ5_9BACT|nr:hypothetical protein [Pseudobacteriovorax antillogorgiicola]TCS54686.1 hypothetical protein EDD56_106199 [Pseudobacteriovorax antillogorgiicola]SMF16533.1 hypothetical protein SAMN06296036_10644 [Pseudobacteriovorax antillogorgiicola]
MRLILLVMILLGCQESAMDSQIDRDSDSQTEQDSADAIPESILVNPPVPVAGAFLYCQSVAESEDSETVACRLTDESDRLLDPIDFDIKAARLIYEDDVIVDSSPSLAALDGWSFSLVGEHTASKVEIDVELEGQVQTMRALIHPNPLEPLRFDINLLGEDFVHLGDNSSIGGDDCAAVTGVEDSISSGTFFKGRAVETRILVKQAGSLIITLVGACDVNTDGLDSIRLFQVIEGQNSQILAETIFNSDGSHTLSFDLQEPGTFAIRVSSEAIPDSGRLDEFMFKNITLESNYSIILDAPQFLAE